MALENFQKFGKQLSLESLKSALSSAPLPLASLASCSSREPAPPEKRVPTLSDPSKSSLADRRRSSKEQANDPEEWDRESVITTLSNDQRKVEAKGKGKGRRGEGVSKFDSLKFPVTSVDKDAMNIKKFKCLLEFVNSKEMQQFGNPEDKPAPAPMLRCPSLQSLASEVDETAAEKQNMSPIDKATVDLLTSVRKRRDRYSFVSLSSASQDSRGRSGSCHDLCTPAALENQLSWKVDNLTRRHSVGVFSESRAPREIVDLVELKSKSTKSCPGVTPNCSETKSEMPPLDGEGASNPGSPVGSDACNGYAKRRSRRSMTYSERRQSIGTVTSEVLPAVKNSRQSIGTVTSEILPAVNNSPSGSTESTTSPSSPIRSPYSPSICSSKPSIKSPCSPSAASTPVTKERMALSYQERRRARKDTKILDYQDFSTS